MAQNNSKIIIFTSRVKTLLLETFFRSVEFS